jgi:hypothetical protein
MVTVMMTWTLRTDIDAPPTAVQQAIADEHALLAWSAWPEATGFQCAVEGDGTSVGSTIVFRNATGVEQGRQRLTLVTPDRVEYRLRNRGPLGRTVSPELDFRVETLEPDRTRVMLDFRASVPLPPGPRHLVELLLGSRVRRLHVEDLRRLKAHVEGVDSTR